MKKSRLLAAALAAVSALVLSACSSEPVYYSKDEVKSYVKSIFGTEYRLVDTVSYADDTDEQNPIYEYVFDNGEHRFSVYTSTRHVQVDASTSIFYQKSIYDDYVSTYAELRAPELRALCAEAPIEAVLDESNYISIYVTGEDEFSAAAELLADVDALMAFEYEYTNFSENRHNAQWCATVYLYPEGTASANDKDAYQYKIASIPMSHHAADRQTQEEIQASIERQYASKTSASAGTSATAAPEEAETV